MTAVKKGIGKPYRRTLSKGELKELKAFTDPRDAIIKQDSNPFGMGPKARQAKKEIDDFFRDNKLFIISNGIRKECIPKSAEPQTC